MICKPSSGINARKQHADFVGAILWRGSPQPFLSKEVHGGCILKVYDKDRLYVWEAVAIERGTYPISQYPDKFYPKASRNRIYKLQKRYNADYWNAIGWTSMEGSRTPKKVLFEPLELE